MERFLITHILSPPKELEYGLSVAASNFSWNLINGGVFDKFFSILPAFVTTKPMVDMPELVFSNLRTKGKIFSKIAPLIENWRIFICLPKECSVWLYNITSLNVFLFFLLKWFRPHTKLNVIILDYTPANDWFSKLCLWAYNHADGTIRLANSSLFTVENTACLPGVTPVTNNDLPRQIKVNREFLISGVLSEKISLLSLVLDTFSRIKDITLHITGFLQDESILNKYKDNKNIVYHGKLSYNDYLKVFHQCSFQLSTRDPKSPENHCNFPSKVMEALLHNRIVISTIPYEQLVAVKYFQVSAVPDLFLKDIERICSLKDEELLSYANQSLLVKTLFNPSVWKRTMVVIENNNNRSQKPTK